MWDTIPRSRSKRQPTTFKARPRPMLNNHPTKPPQQLDIGRWCRSTFPFPCTICGRIRLQVSKILCSLPKMQRMWWWWWLFRPTKYQEFKNPKYQIMSLSFIRDTMKTSPQNPRSKVVLPNTWSPKMYLSALNKSICKNSILSIELITIDGRVYSTINELQWLFSATEEATHSQLICSASHIRVSGGVLKQV